MGTRTAVLAALVLATACEEPPAGPGPAQDAGGRDAAGVEVGVDAATLDAAAQDAARADAARTDLAGGDATSPDAANTDAIDDEPPSVTVEQHGQQPDPAYFVPVNFVIRFSEGVEASSLSPEDIVHGGSATGVTWHIGAVDTMTFNLSAIEVGSDGTLIPSLPAGAVTDLSGNPSLASTSVDNVVTCIVEPLAVTVEQGPDQADPTNIAPVVFDVRFGAPIDVATFEAADFALSVDGYGRVLTNAGDDQSFTLELTPGASGVDDIIDVYLPEGRVLDLDGHRNAHSAGSGDSRVRFDDLAPLPDLSPAPGQALETSTLPVVFTLDFGEPVEAIALDTADVTQLGTAPGVSWQIEDSGDGQTFTLAATAAGDGTVWPGLVEAATLDLAGNPSLPAQGAAVLYATSPILSLHSAEVAEGEALDYAITLTAPAVDAVGFDWALQSDTATADVDFTAAAGAAAIDPGASSAVIHIETLEDHCIEGTEQLSLLLSNVTGTVHAGALEASVSIDDDDRGWQSFDWFDQTSTYDDYTTDLWLLATDADTALVAGQRKGALGYRLIAYELGDGERRVARTYDEDLGRPLGLALTTAGAFVLLARPTGWALQRRALDTLLLDPGFGTAGELEGGALADTFAAELLLADSDHLYLLSDDMAVGSGAWAVEKVDVLDGSDDPGFGEAGLVVVSTLGSGAAADLEDAVLADGAIYVAGYDGGIEQHVVTKLGAADGVVDTAFGSGGSIAIDCGERPASPLHLAVAGDDLYTACADVPSMVERRSALDGSLALTGSSPARIDALAADGGGVYLGGQETSEGEWYVEKRDRGGLALIWSDQPGYYGGALRKMVHDGDGLTSAGIIVSRLYDYSAGHVYYQRWRVDRRASHSGELNPR